MVKKYRVPIIMLCVAVFLMIIGATVGTLWTMILTLIMNQQLPLSESSISYSFWKETPVPMYFKVYFFNWTNTKEFQKNNSIKPHFAEMGPYVFNEVDTKLPVKWNDNDTLTFHQKKQWHFIPSMSNGSLTDVVTNLNPVLATLNHLVPQDKPIIKYIIDEFLKRFNETLFIEKTVEELLFKGYTDKVLNFAHKLKLFPYPEFGWFYDRNNSEIYDGTFNMMRGENNVHEIGLIKEWNYNHTTKFYDGNCNKIDGFIGDLWPPLMNNKTVSIFVPDFCTSMTLEFDKRDVVSYLIGHKYISNEAMLDNGTTIEKRKCYCPKKDCQPSGTLYVGKCKFNSPVFISLPHFYLADKSYIRAISGMNPDRNKHEFYIIIEPNTGVPMEVQAKLQINLLIEKNDKIKSMKGITKTYVPMLWFTQEAQITPTISKKLRFVTILPTLGHATFFAICGAGIFLVIVAISEFVRRKRKNEDRQVLLN